MGIPTLISTSTASNASSVAITSGIDSTYDEYMFVFTDIGPATNSVNFTFNGSDDTSSHSYDITKTTTGFNAYHNEGGSSAALSYDSTNDIAEGTGYLGLGIAIGNGADESLAGILHLFSPASTTYVTHFYARTNIYHASDFTEERYLAGYFNATAAITALDFKMSSGNFDGVIQMFGIS